MINGDIFFTQNNAETVYTNFTGGTPWKPIWIRITDGTPGVLSNSIFNFNGTNLKGQVPVSYSALNGDLVFAIFDGVNWQCLIVHTGHSIANTVDAGKYGITQTGTKSTALTQDNVLCGSITMVIDGVGITGSNGFVQFNLNNNQLGAFDSIMVWQNGGPHAQIYKIAANLTALGQAVITVTNMDTITHDDAVVIYYEIRKH